MKLPSLPFRLRASGGSAAVVDADEADDGKPGLKAVLAGRLRALGQAAAARMQQGPPEVPLAFPLAVAGLLFVLVGTVLWLILAADHTLAQRRARVPVAAVPVLLPDGTPRGGGGAAPGTTVDPVDMPVELGPSKVDANLESGRFGPLPRIAPDGKAPWQIYARPFPQADTRPRIALVLTDVGLSAPTTDSAVNRLPGAVTFAIAAGTAGLQAIVDKVRGTGHEVLLTVPMEPNGYPRNDPGPNTLLTSLPDERNAERLERARPRRPAMSG